MPSWIFFLLTSNIGSQGGYTDLFLSFWIDSLFIFLRFTKNTRKCRYLILISLLSLTFTSYCTFHSSIRWYYLLRSTPSCVCSISKLCAYQTQSLTFQYITLLCTICMYCIYVHLSSKDRYARVFSNANLKYLIFLWFNDLPISRKFAQNGKCPDQ